MRHVVQAKDFEFISRDLLPKQTSSDSTSVTLPSMTMVDKLVIPVLAEKEREILQTLDDKLMALHFKEDQVKLTRSKSLFESPYLPVTVGNYPCRYVCVMYIYACINAHIFLPFSLVSVHQYSCIYVHDVTSVAHLFQYECTSTLSTCIRIATQL